MGPPVGYHYPGPYYCDSDCSWVRVRVWRHGHWVWRRASRCWSYVGCNIKKGPPNWRALCFLR